jgi:hypothetical protein
MHRFAVALLLSLAVLGLGGLDVARAADGRADRCASAHLGCVNACDVLERDDAGRAGCAARCATDRAVCEAGAGIEALTEQTDRVKGFLEGLAEGYAGGGPETSAECDLTKDVCSMDCRTRYGADEGALAGCASRCVTDQALCQARAQLKAATPKVKEEVDRWTRFLEGFMDEKGGFALPEGFAPGEEPDAAPEAQPGDGKPGTDI